VSRLLSTSKGGGGGKTVSRPRVYNWKLRKNSGLTKNKGQKMRVPVFSGRLKKQIGGKGTPSKQQVLKEGSNGKNFSKKDYMLKDWVGKALVKT